MNNAKKVELRCEISSLSPSGHVWRAYLYDEELNGFTPLYLSSESSESLKKKVKTFVNGIIDFRIDLRPPLGKTDDRMACACSTSTRPPLGENGLCPKCQLPRTKNTKPATVRRTRRQHSLIVDPIDEGDNLGASPD